MIVRHKQSRPAHGDLTVGNVYQVLGIEADDLRIMNDVGQPYLYPVSLFEVVDNTEPSDWKTTVGPDGERYAYPPALALPGFFEDYFDGQRAARATLQVYLLRTRQKRPPQRRAAG